MAKKVRVWRRNRALEERALKDWMYRVGTLGGVLAAWITVGTGILTFVELSVAVVVLVLGLTLWDFWKIWKAVWQKRS